MRRCVLPGETAEGWIVLRQSRRARGCLCSGPTGDGPEVPGREDHRQGSAEGALRAPAVEAISDAQGCLVQTQGGGTGLAQELAQLYANLPDGGSEKKKKKKKTVDVSVCLSVCSPTSRQQMLTLFYFCMLSLLT